MRTVLLTGAGGSGTVDIIRSLKASGRYRIVALDASFYSRGFSLADAGYVVPFATDRQFVTSLEQIYAKEHPNFVIPLVDEEIPHFHALAKKLGPQGPQVVAPRREFCEATLDKWKTYSLLHEAGIPTPETHLASEVSGSLFPAVVKPRDGRGSREVAYLNGPKDLKKFLQERCRTADHYVVQRQAVGTEYTVSVVVALSGEVLAVVPKEVLIKKGITQVGATRQHAGIDTLCRSIQTKLKADGPFNVQLILERGDQPTVIEINPRYSTTVALTLASGINEVDVVLRHAMGETVSGLNFQPNLLMIRHQTQEFMSEGEWPPKQVQTLKAGEAMVS